MWQTIQPAPLPKNYSDSWNPREYSHKSTTELQNYAANLRLFIQRGKDGNGRKPWNPNGIFEGRMEERLEGLERLVEGRLTMEDFKSGPPKPQTISELYWKNGRSNEATEETSPGTTSTVGGMQQPKEKEKEDSPSVAAIRKEMEFQEILKKGREFRENEESLRRSSRIAEKRKAIHALLPTPGMPISLQLRKRRKTEKTESGSSEDSDCGEKELEIDPLLQ
jgi:hypothetical protein